MENISDELDDRLDDIERTVITWMDHATKLELTISKLSWQIAELEKRVSNHTTFQQALVAKVDRLIVAKEEELSSYPSVRKVITPAASEETLRGL